MKVRAISSLFVVGMLSVVSCTVGFEDESLSDDFDLADEDQLGSIEESIVKGRPGAINGATDYCNDAANVCALGEGDCDSSAQCAMGLACIANNGPKFGFGATWDVCAGAHCANQVMDGDETSTDCGGSCGTCSTCVGTPGSATFCVGCLCASGQGDCDSTSECGSGLTCGTNNGPKFGLGATYDVCVPAHCTNRILDAASGETGVDLGGPCAASCGNAVLNTGEACDEATNDGLLCNPDCTVGPEVARIHEHCDPGSAVISSLKGSQCITIQGGASYLTFVSGAVAVTMYSNGDCTGMSTTRTSPVNFCGGTFNEGGGLNDQVRSAKVSRL